MTVRVDDIGDFLTIKLELVPASKAMRRSKFLAMAHTMQKFADEALPDKMRASDIGLPEPGKMIADDLGIDVKPCTTR